jgi:hypothetical protein
MMAKSGENFELLIKAIYEEMLSADGYGTVRVEHNVKLLGKSGHQHQVDVYWQFKIAGVTHKVAVECKDYQSSVSIGKIRDFYGVLEDVGDVRGVFVTTKGYQKGALEYAKEKKIDLQVIREPTQEDIDSGNRIKQIGIFIKMLCIGNIRYELELDNEWIVANKILSDGDSLALNCLSNEYKILDSFCNLLGTIHDFENKLPRTLENTTDLVKKFDFHDAYLQWPNSKYPPLKIKSIRFKYDTYTISSEIKHYFKYLAKKFMEDIVSNNIYLYNIQASRGD